LLKLPGRPPAAPMRLFRAKIRFASALLMITWVILLAIVAAYALRQADRIRRQIR